MDSELTKNERNIQNKIFPLRNQQIMLDRDLAELYQVETRALKQAVKRNIERFPDDFMFELTDTEIVFFVSQSVIPSKKHLGGAIPFAFTEQGVSMLSAVLTSKIAIENREIKPKQGIFYDGQIFDAYKFVAELIKGAKKSIVLIDNYVDETVLTLFGKNQRVNVKIYTKNITKQLKLDLDKYNAQYKRIEIKKFNQAHDRFLIIDNKEVYHFGASLKDLGKKWFAFSKFDMNAIEMLGKLK